MLKISVKSDIERALARLNALQRQVVPTATARALNKTAAQARTEAARQIKTRYQIPTRVISRAITLTQRANRAQLTAVVEASGHPLPLIAFRARQTRRGVSVEVTRGARKLIRSAFIATLRSGHKGVFARGVYSGGRFIPHPQRLPITELMTLGIPQGFSNRAVEQALRQKVTEKFPAIFDHELAFALSRQ